MGNSLTNFRKFGHSFRTRNARKSMKGSNDSYDSLESNKTFSYEIGSIGPLPQDVDFIQM